jgi:hypothetical protein
MANPTTNYGFVLPTPTDLVTDLPADFEVALQGVDTQMKTNADAAIAKSTFTTKGDLLVATGASTFIRQGVGANGTVLTANSAQADGVEWVTPSSGAFTSIATGSLSGSTITISSIPSTYTDLKLYITNLDISVDTKFRLRFNGDSGSSQYAYQNSNNAGGFAGGAGTSIQTTNADIDNTVGQQGCFIDLAGYTLANTWKIADIRTIGTTLSSGFDNGFTYAAWKSTAAISSITMFLSTGAFTGTYTLYGVK